MSSKLRNLKQQAYESGRKRDWAGAAEAYAAILEMDKNNPSLLNEYGDVCVKAGDVPKAIRHFLSAAAKYRQTGLLNNAQAVYKKVLRYDAGNLNANWFLAEIRSTQGLIADGEKHALTFLSGAEEVSGEIKEIFLKRCLEIFTLFPASDAVLEKVEGIFRISNLALESARAGCLRACIAWRAGRQDEAKAWLARIVATCPELTNYAEYARWQETIGCKAKPANFADVNTVSLEPAASSAPASDDPAVDRDAAAAEAEAADGIEPAAAGEPEGETAPRAREPLAGDSGLTGEPALEIDDAADGDVERDEDGCITIETDPTTSFTSLLEDVTVRLERGPDEAVESPTAAGSAPTGGTVNLLDEILAEEGEDILRSSETEQVSTIASEIGRNLGETADADPEVLYQQGLVYLEMGLCDQAVIALAAAAAAPAYALQAREMWGIALYRSGKLAEALAVLEQGLERPGADGPAGLGLRYHAGRILEELGQDEAAQAHYRRVHTADAGFADVAQRLHVSVP